MTDRTEPSTILVVEDEVFVRLIAADMLSDSGFRVLEAGDAREALDLLAGHGEVAVLFTDINMPGDMDGLALAAQVAKMRPEVKVIVTSGKRWIPDSELPDASIFLPKPYRAADLAALVQAQTEA